MAFVDNVDPPSRAEDERGGVSATQRETRLDGGEVQVTGGSGGQEIPVAPVSRLRREQRMRSREAGAVVAGGGHHRIHGSARSA
ncbi:MAG TPA: hypothetical protein VF070_03005, partial [Streptosporangiaceae bacterium]